MKTLNLEQMEQVEGRFRWETCIRGGVILGFYGTTAGGLLGLGAGLVGGCLIQGLDD